MSKIEDILAETDFLDSIKMTVEYQHKKSDFSLDYFLLVCSKLKRSALKNFEIKEQILTFLGKKQNSLFVKIFPVSYHRLNNSIDRIINESGNFNIENSNFEPIVQNLVQIYFLEMFSDDIDAAKDCVLKSVDKINKTLYLNPIFAKLQNLFKITDLANFYQFLDFCLTFLKNKKIFEQTEKTAKAKIQILSKKFDLNPRSSFKFTSKINKFCINLAIEKFKIHFYFLKNDLKSYQIFSKFLSILKFCYKNAKPNDEKFLIEKIFNSSQLEHLINLEEKFINLKMDKILKIKDKWISFKTLFIFNKEIKISIFSEAVIELLFSIKRRFYILSHFAANLTENMLKRLLRILKNEFEIEKNNKAQICGFLNCCDHFYQILDNWKFGQNTNFSKITLKKSFHFLKLKLSNFVLDCFKTFLTEILFFDEMVDKKEFLNFSNLNSVLHDFYFDLSSCNKKTFVTAFFSCLNDKTIELLALIKNKKIEQNSSDLFLTKLDILDCYKIAKEILNSNCILFKFDEETVTVLSLLCAGSDSLKFLEEVIEHKNFDEIYFVLEKNKLNNLALENVKTFLD